MDCPVCLKQMDKLDLINTEVDNCRFCGGIWLDGNELGSFIQRGKIPKRLLTSYALDDGHQKVAEGKRACPRCKAQFLVVTHKDVNIDYCEECGGFWFDRGELKKIMEQYVREAKGEKKKPLQSRVVQEFDEDGDEMIRIDDEGIFEYTKDEKKEQEIQQEMESDPFAREVLAAGSKELIVRALPKSIAEGKDPIQMGSLGPMSSPMGGSKISPLGMSMGMGDNMGRYRGRYGAGNLLFDSLVAVFKSIFEARKL